MGEDQLGGRERKPGGTRDTAPSKERREKEGREADGETEGEKTPCRATCGFCYPRTSTLKTSPNCKPLKGENNSQRILSKSLGFNQIPKDSEIKSLRKMPLYGVTTEGLFCCFCFICTFGDQTNNSLADARQAHTTAELHAQP